MRLLSPLAEKFPIEHCEERNYGKAKEDYGEELNCLSESEFPLRRPGDIIQLQKGAEGQHSQA